MTSTEEINGLQVVIEWEFESIEDSHGNYYLWSITGEGDNGKRYSGECYADAHGNDVSEISVIEQIKF